MSASGTYRLFFKGGLVPKAMARIDENSMVGKVLWFENQTTGQVTCKLPAPPQLPVGTVFMGAGVCQDINDRQVPCAIYRHKSFRIRTYSDYMTFYNSDGMGPNRIKLIITGANQDAMPAELEFQIGLSLIKTRCCKQSGLKYMENAYKLFPDSTLYRMTYLRYRAEIYARQGHQLSSN